MKKHFLSVCAALFALMVLCSVTTRAADNVYAILYDDGTLVFQHGNTPESGRTVIKTYEVDLNAVYVDGNTVYDNRVPWHSERESVRVVNFADKISPTATTAWFFNCTNLERVDNIQNLDTANVTNMCCLFYGCSKLTALDVSHFDTANVTDMRWMFHSCSGLTTLDVSHFDTANVTNMACMFQVCSGLTTLDVSHFDTAKVTSMAYMFLNCSKLTTLNVSHFNTANVQSMRYMFHGCSGLMTLDVSPLDTANVTTMSYMFAYCYRLAVLDISNFDTAKVKNMECMFSNCSNLQSIFTSDRFITASIPETEDYNSRNMFENCTALVGGNGTGYDSEHVDKEYARIDTPSTPGYFILGYTPETYVITAYAGEGGTVTPAGDTRISAGGTQKYVMTPNPGYRVLSVRIDGVEVGALSEYVFQNVVTGHNLVVSFERLPRYAITAAVSSGDELSVTLENSGAVTVVVWYADRNGQFLSADMQTVSANAGTVTFPLPFAYKARVTLLDSRYAPLCDPVAVR
ncbi:MAG: BspA family leucine-rich repeat surface protein [Oscillospiraceae bacterium]|nr:BspA family leucine-rich repeat surface protein [Oscillospiraceae bacterium]